MVVLDGIGLASSFSAHGVLNENYVERALDWET